MKTISQTIIADRDAELMSGWFISPDRLEAAGRRDSMNTAAEINGTEGLIRFLLERKLGERRKNWRSIRRTWRRYRPRAPLTSPDENWLKRRLALAELLDSHRNMNQAAKILRSLNGAICGWIPR